MKKLLIALLMMTALIGFLFAGPVELSKTSEYVTEYVATFGVGADLAIFVNIIYELYADYDDQIFTFIVKKSNPRASELAQYMSIQLDGDRSTIKIGDKTFIAEIRFNDNDASFLAMTSDFIVLFTLGGGW